MEVTHKISSLFEELIMDRPAMTPRAQEAFEGRTLLNLDDRRVASPWGTCCRKRPVGFCFFLFFFFFFKGLKSGIQIFVRPYPELVVWSGGSGNVFSALRGQIMTTGYRRFDQGSFGH